MGIHKLSEKDDSNKYKIIAVIHDNKKGKHQTNDILAIDVDSSEGDPMILKGSKVFEPVNDPATRKINYIAGASGSGKSTFAKKLIIKHSLMFPEAPIYILSRLDNDPAFDKLEADGMLIRIPIDEEFVEQPIDMLEDIPEGSLVVFDDIDTFRNKETVNVINNLKLQIFKLFLSQYILWIFF